MPDRGRTAVVVVVMAGWAWSNHTRTEKKREGGRERQRERERGRERERERESERERERERERATNADAGVALSYLNSHNRINVAQCDSAIAGQHGTANLLPRRFGRNKLHNFDKIVLVRHVVIKPQLQSHANKRHHRWAKLDHAGAADRHGELAHNLDKFAIGAVLAHAKRWRKGFEQTL